MEERHFILGKGELLTSPITIRHHPLDKAYPYTFEESIERLIPELRTASKELDILPDGACPADFAVETMTLNPSFIARSYYPTTLFEKLSLIPIGSRNVTIQVHS